MSTNTEEEFDEANEKAKEDTKENKKKENQKKVNEVPGYTEPNTYLSEEESETALKILEDLSGTPICRAESILEVCKMAIRISPVNLNTKR